MPLLDFDSVKALRETPVERCPECEYAVYRSYCRECDEYCHLGHGWLCQQPTAVSDRVHEQHRHY
jgi:hypothetical protein